MFYERLPVGTGVGGGMGGGIVVDGIWLHPNLGKLGVEPAVLNVMANRRARIVET